MLHRAAVPLVHALRPGATFNTCSNITPQPKLQLPAELAFGPTNRLAFRPTPNGFKPQQTTGVQPTSKGLAVRPTKLGLLPTYWPSTQQTEWPSA